MENAFLKSSITKKYWKTQNFKNSFKPCGNTCLMPMLSNFGLLTPPQSLRVTVDVLKPSDFAQSAFLSARASYEDGYLRTVVKGGWRFFLRRFVRIGPICLKPHFWAFWDITTHARNLFGRKIPSELGDTGGGSWKTFHFRWFGRFPRQISYVNYIGDWGKSR